MISVYPSSEKNFADNGLKILKPLKAVITKEDNGDYFLEIKDKIDYIDYYQSGMIIRVPTPWGYQGFRIINPEIEKNIISAKAKHLYFDSANYIIKDSYVVDKNCNDALDHLNSSCDVQTPFTTISNISKTASIRCVRKSLEEAIVTVIDRWGGHLDRDNYNIAIKSRIGQDRGVTIAANKNLKGFSKKENWDSVITKILPVGKDGITLPEVYIELEEELYEIPYTKVITFEQYDIKEEDYTIDGILNEDAYKEALISNLRTQANNYLENNKLPKINYVVESSIKDVSDVGDTIYIKHPKCKVDLITNVISIEYDCIQNKYISIEFGNFRNKLKNLIENISSGIEEKTSKSIKENTALLEKELNDATNSIKSAMSNSYVIYNGDKILIVDKLPAEKAKNCILINNGGIGFSKDGINGTFNSAWEIDGTLNMQYINVINLVADMIKGGTLKIGGKDNANGVVEIYDNNGKLITKIDNNGIDFNISEIINLTKEVTNDGNYLILNNTPTSYGAINKLIISNFNKQLLFPNMARPFKKLNPKYLNFYTLIFSNEKILYVKKLPQANESLENKIYNVAGINGKYYKCIKNSSNVYEWIEAIDLIYQEIYIPSPIPLQTIVVDNKTYSDEIVIENNIVKINQNVSKTGTILSSPIIHNLGAYTIPTFTDNTYLTLKYFNNLHFECKYMIDNEFTNIFTTQAEQTADMQIIANQIASKVSQKDMESAIIQMAEEINIEVKKKVNNNEIIAAINLSSEEAKILAKKIILEGLVTANENFKVLLDGSIEAQNGSFAGNIYLGDGGLVIGGTGILNTMVIPGVINSPGFLLSGDFCPMGDYWDGSNIHTKEHISFSFYIPENFTIINAYIYLQHEPCETDYWEYGTSATTQSKKTGYCRNLALYKGTIGSYSKKYISELAANFVGNANVNYSQITSAWQNSGTLFSGTNNSVNSDISINLKSQNLISSGLNHLAIMSTGGTTGDLTGTYYEKRGAVLATLYIQGYLKN